MKKVLPSLLLASVLISAPTLAFAESGKEKSGDQRLKIEFRHHSDDRNDDHKKATSTKRVAKVTSAQINTYADVTAILAGFSTTTNSLKLAVTTTASSSLSNSELALYTTLNPKGTKPERVNTQADAIIAKINSLQSLVSPLGSQSVTTSFGIKDLVVRELNKIGNSINALAKLSATVK